MARELRRAGLVVTSNGRTIYEVAYMAIPSITIAQNERESTHTLIHKRAAISYLGRACDVSEKNIAAALEKLLGNYKLRKKMHLGLKRLKLHAGVDRVIRLIFDKYYDRR